MSTTEPARSAAARLEHVVGVALSAQALARDGDLLTVESHLDTVDPEFVGFGVEGAAMGLVVLDEREPAETRRFDALLAGRWSRYDFLMHAGAGLGLAELHLPVHRHVDRPELEAAFAIDGYAFHLAFVAPGDHLAGQPVPDDFDGPAARVFDNGLSRALWFACSADPDAVAAGVSAFADARQRDVWAGVGFAATYAGGLGTDGIRALQQSAARHRGDLAAGAALAAHTRLRCGNLVESTARTCEVLAGCAAEEADELCRDARAVAGADTSIEAFVAWRHRIGELVPA